MLLTKIWGVLARRTPNICNLYLISHHKVSHLNTHVSNVGCLFEWKLFAYSARKSLNISSSAVLITPPTVQGYILMCNLDTPSTLTQCFQCIVQNRFNNIPWTQTPGTFVHKRLDSTDQVKVNLLRQTTCATHVHISPNVVLLSSHLIRTTKISRLIQYQCDLSPRSS